LRASAISRSSTSRLVIASCSPRHETGHRLLAMMRIHCDIIIAPAL
jgi:hypothetical protein